MGGEWREVEGTEVNGEVGREVKSEGWKAMARVMGGRCEKGEGKIWEGDEEERGMEWMEGGWNEGREKGTQHPFNTSELCYEQHQNSNKHHLYFPCYVRVVLFTKYFLVGAMSDVKIIPLLLFTNLGLSGLSCGGVQHRRTIISAPSGCTAFVRFRRTTLYFMSFLCWGAAVC